MKVPTFKEKICVKATRISWAEYTKSNYKEVGKGTEPKQIKKESINLFDQHQSPQNHLSYSQQLPQSSKAENKLHTNLLEGFSINSPNNPVALNLLGEFS
jgi:hypothetical protein